MADKHEFIRRYIKLAMKGPLSANEEAEFAELKKKVEPIAKVSGKILLLMSFYQVAHLIGFILLLALNPSGAHLEKRDELLAKYHRAKTSGSKFKLFWKIFIRNALNKKVTSVQLFNIVVVAMEGYMLLVAQKAVLDMDIEKVDYKKVAKHMAISLGVRELILATGVLFQTVHNINTGRDSRVHLIKAARQKSEQKGKKITYNEARKMSKDQLLAYVYGTPSPKNKNKKKK